MLQRLTHWAWRAACLLSFVALALLVALAFIQRRHPRVADVTLGRLRVSLHHGQLFLVYAAPRPRNVGPPVEPWRGGGPYYRWLNSMNTPDFQFLGLRHGTNSAVRTEGGRFVSDVVYQYYNASDLYLVAAAGALPLFVPLRVARRQRLRRARRKAGQCVHCGYDRRGTDPASACPECGRHAAEPAHAWPQPT